MTPSQVASLMEGLVGTMSANASGLAYQDVAAWVDMCKQIMRMPANRDLTDWKFQALSDCDEDGSAETGDADLIGATALYGALFATIETRAERNFAFISDADSVTVDGGGIPANTAMAILQLPAAASASYEEYFGVLFPKGIALATGLTVGADGRDGTTPASDAIRAWILFR